jgi:tRNA A37 methylthiotransferase MiaB
VRPRTFSIQTLGCKVNQYEGEQLATLLRARGLAPAPADRADLRVVHTCSVTVQAASKSRQLTRRTVGGANESPPPPTAAAPMPRPSINLPVLGDGGRGDARAGTAACQTSEPTAAQPPRVVVTGCWATSDPAAARAVPGVTAVITHHDDVAAELDRLLESWHAGGAEPREADTADSFGTAP